MHLIVTGCLKMKVRSGRGTSYLATVPTLKSTWKKRKKWKTMPFWKRPTLETAKWLVFPERGSGRRREE